MCSQCGLEHLEGTATCLQIGPEHFNGTTTYPQIATISSVGQAVRVGNHQQRGEGRAPARTAGRDEQKAQTLSSAGSEIWVESAVE